jgi:glycine hydroxymethyltransferase
VKRPVRATERGTPPLLGRLLRAHEKWRLENCLNLIVSENFTSPAVRKMLGCDLTNRYTAPDKFYMGSKYTDEIQLETENLAKEVFEADYADVRPLSGHSADMILLTALAKRGDKIMIVGKAHGGYPGISEEGYPRVYGLQVSEFPFSRQLFNIDVEQAAVKIEVERPRIVIFGASMFLFPHPVKALGEACRSVGAKIAFDGSHVLGLIAGKQFQDPLREGASVLIGSTHKSLFGPQGGMILANDYEEQLRGAVLPGIVDNAHWNRIAALYVALSEMKKFGKRYASQVVRNSKILAAALDKHGVSLVGKDHGFTKSHQTIVDVASQAEGVRLARRLEEANIIVDSGMRIGTCEETRRGMREPEMNQIAELIARVLVEKEDPKKVRRDVRRLRSEFTSVHFC